MLPPTKRIAAVAIDEVAGQEATLNTEATGAVPTILAEVFMTDVNDGDDDDVNAYVDFELN